MDDLIVNLGGRRRICGGNGGGYSGSFGEAGGVDVACFAKAAGDEDVWVP